MKQHAAIGERILCAAPALTPVARLVRAAHERWDGAGYPDRTAGEAIPLGSRIIAACDANASMTSERSYRTKRERAAAIDELRRCAGSQFDPAIVEVLCTALETEPDLANPDRPMPAYPALAAAARGLARVPEDDDRRAAA